MDYDEASGVAVDAHGNVLVVGYTDGALPGQKSAGWRDAFVRKYDPNGKELWTRQFGSTEDDTAFGVAVDAQGNVLVVGETYNVLPAHKSAGRRDIFVRKYDPNGKELWTQQFGSMGYDGAFGVAVDAQGNVLVVRGTGGAVFVRKYSP